MKNRIVILIALVTSALSANAQWSQTGDVNRGTQFYQGPGIGGGVLGYSLRTATGGGWAWQLVDATANQYFDVAYPTGNVTLKGHLTLADNNQIRLRPNGNADTGMSFFYDGVSVDEVRITHSKDSYNRYITLGSYNLGTTTFNPQFRLNTKNGNVGIGTTPATNYKLAVNGKVWATEVNVSLTVPGPDYVFNEDYTLPSIESVKSYIGINKHLPDVPSATEMQTNGINVSELNMTLLRKIEELTLYTIQLKEEVDSLKAEMKKAR